MSENCCGSERRGKEKVMEWTLSSGKEARTRIWGLGMERKGILHMVESVRLNQGHCLMSACPAALPFPSSWPRCLPC